MTKAYPPSLRISAQAALPSQHPEALVTRQAPEQTGAIALASPRGRVRLRAGGQFMTLAAALALVWAMLTDWRLESWVFGAPAVLLGAGVGLVLPYRPSWRFSARGLLLFMAWFAVQSVRGGCDVALRAISPRPRLRPGFRSWPLTLPGGAPRVLFVNAITLLPGTLSAEVEGDLLTVHMLDTHADLDAELGHLERRVRALFGLSVSVSNPVGAL